MTYASVILGLSSRVNERTEMGPGSWPVISVWPPGLSSCNSTTSIWVQTSSTGFQPPTQTGSGCFGGSDPLRGLSRRSRPATHGLPAEASFCLRRRPLRSGETELLKEHWTTTPVEPERCVSVEALLELYNGIGESVVVS